MTEKLLVEYITDFLEYCELDRALSPLTVKMYAHYLNRFSDWLTEGGKKIRPDELNEEIVRQYRLYLSRYVNPVKGELKRSTQGYFLIALRSFLRYLTKKGISTLAPDQIELGKTRDRVIKFLDKNQLEKLLGAVDTSNDQGLRDRAILEMLFSTGLRVSELVKLDRQKINVNSREIGITGKGGRTRVVFLSERAVSCLSRYLTTRQDTWGPLFVRFRGGRGGKPEEEQTGNGFRLSVRGVQRIVEKYVKKARLPINASPHTLRHVFATDLLRNGADLRSVQELLGHKNIATTQIYTHVTNPQLKETFEKFHDK